MNLYGDRFSAVKTASALIHTGACVFSGLVLTMDGTNTVTMNVYDGVDNTGVKIMPELVIPTSASNRSFPVSFNPGLPLRTGLYVEISVAGGGSASYTAYFRG